MKADSDDEKDRDINPYSKENEELRLMHLERLNRIKKEKEQPKDEGDEATIVKQIKTDLIQEKKQSIKQHKNTKIWLNSVIYDQRKLGQKKNMITLPTLFQDVPSPICTKPFSQNIVAIMISTFGFQSEVLKPIAQLGVPFFVINRMEELPQGRVERSYCGFKNMHIISPPKEGKGYGVFHTKLWLIKFKEFLRVVVCTGNNHASDWAIWQNAYWFQDFPLSPLGTDLNDAKPETGFNYNKDFVDTLQLVIGHLQPKSFDLLKEMNINLSKYLFTNINVILIPSFAGRFKNEEMSKVGLEKVKSIMKKYARKYQKPTLTYNSTSLGMINEMHIRQIYFSFCPYVLNFSPQSFRLVYPTSKYIAEQTCGQSQVLFLTAQNYKKSDTLKSKIFYKYEQSKSNGVLGGIPHLKTIIIESNDPSEDGCVLYVGSHNMTRAAWGSYEKNESQLHCMNDELGLLFLDYKKQQLLEWLPYRYPPMKYSPEDTPFFRQM